MRVSESLLLSSGLRLFSWMPSPRIGIHSAVVALWSRMLNDDWTTFSSCDLTPLLHSWPCNVRYDMLFILNPGTRLCINYLVYKLYRRIMPFEYLGGDQATINDCEDETAILISSGGPGAEKIKYFYCFRPDWRLRSRLPSCSVQHVIGFEFSPVPIRVYAATFMV